MLANRYTNQQNDLSQREQHMRDGTLFDVYQYCISTYASGAQKMMALRSFNGMLSIHVCFYCNAWIVIPTQYARVGHFRVEVNTNKGSLEESTMLEVYSKALQELSSWVFPLTSTNSLPIITSCFHYHTLLSTTNHFNTGFLQQTTQRLHLNIVITVLHLLEHL